MARGHKTTYHIIKETKLVPPAAYLLERDPNHGPVKRWVMWCGEEEGSDLFARQWPHFNCCTKCSAKWFADKTNAPGFRFKLGERVDSRADDMPYGIKSAYPVLDGQAWDKADQLVGYITIETGWGEAWSFRELEDPTTYRDLDSGNYVKPRMRRSTDYSSHLKWNKRSEITGELEDNKLETTANRFSSKEQALWHVPDMMAQGKLRTYREVDESGKAQLAKHTAYKAERAATAARATEEAEQRRNDKTLKLAFIKEEFEAMKMNGALTNANVEALCDAAKLLGIELTA